MPTPPVSASFVRRGRQIYGSLRDSTLLIKSDDHQVDPDTVSANERVSLSRYGPMSGCAHVPKWSIATGPALKDDSNSRQGHSPHRPRSVGTVLRVKAKMAA
jgi:hypothetical protein